MTIVKRYRHKMNRRPLVPSGPLFILEPEEVEAALIGS